MRSDWQTKKFGEVCDFIRGPFGGSLKKNIFVEDGYAVYEQSHVIYNQFYKIRYFISEEKFREMIRFEIKPGNLIMSCSGTMGKVAIVPGKIKRGIINQALLQIIPSKHISNTFIKLWMESESFQEKLKLYSLGAAIQNVASVKILKEIPVSFPALNEQQRLVNMLNLLSTETKKLENINLKKLATLEELKKAILHKAFNGDLS
jgi:type I restriction enzyme S subunit